MEVYVDDSKTQNDNIEFDSEPVFCYCLHCSSVASLGESQIVTNVSSHATYKSYLFSAIILLIFGWPGVIILLFFFPISKDVVHRCPSCWNEVGRKRFLGGPKISQNIYTIRCGTCAIVISRKILLSIVGFIVILTSLHFLINWSKSINPESLKGEQIDKTWEQYYHQCASFSTYKRNPIRAVEIFNRSYNDKVVTWTGKVASIDPGLFWFSARLNVTMDPSTVLHIDENQHDIEILVDRRLRSDVAELNPDDIIKFEIQLVILGTGSSPTVARLWRVELLKAAVVDEAFGEGLSEDPLSKDTTQPPPANITDELNQLNNVSKNATNV
eukprot:GHVL01036169.1.p1 GENE.GHVL01036169.1~~GHVL01036169.1.p1  ORF type:complete len:328 (-),score=32.14 GHVL01036169.1:305-1288(-)